MICWKVNLTDIIVILVQKNNIYYDRKISQKKYIIVSKLIIFKNIEFN